MIPYEWIEQAEKRIAGHIRETPLTLDSKRGLYFKWENHQVTGSFKVRGAFNKVLSLEDWERKPGLVAVSAGNHGQGVALAGQLTETPVEVFVPQHAVPSKVDAMRALGAQIHFVDGGYANAESAGRQYALKTGRVFVSPYNDGQVIAGQGTMGLEILREIGQTEVANWVVPTGGGGLISAIGTVLTKVRPRPKLIAVQAAASPFTHALFHQHSQEGIQDFPTLADGLSGAVEAGSVTIPMIEQYIDDFFVVSENAIAAAMAFAWYTYHKQVEGSAAVGLAAILERKVKEHPSVVIISGGNVQPEVHERIVTQYAGETWD